MGDARFDGKVAFSPGYEGSGSMDVEVCLSPEAMSGLESDGEFMHWWLHTIPWG